MTRTAAAFQSRALPLLGRVRVVEKDGRITRLDLHADETPPLPTPPDCAERETALLCRTFRELQEYVSGRRQSFDLPLAPEGTPFQQRVWRALQDIPYGRTRSYRQIAEAVDCPGGWRAIGMANNRNPIAVLIPCHRVIGADGRLVGYGSGLPLKEALLRLEGCI